MMRVLSSFNPVLILLSWICVAFGQPVWSGTLSWFASVGGFALFWHVALKVPSRISRFWMGTLWFATVQAVQLSWMSNTTYMGPLILVVFSLLSLGMGLQFGFLTLLVEKPLSWLRILMVSGVWVWMEWIRLGLLTGFAWNFVGLSLAGEASIPFASLLGMYGLSFWVILTNLCALRSAKSCAVFALLPYLFSWCYVSYWEKRESFSPSLSVALVQTALRIEEKDFMRPLASSFLSPVVQWQRILESLPSGEKKIDAIVLPESAVPWGEARCYYPLELVQKTWTSLFGPESARDFPPLEAPFAKEKAPGQWVVSNSFWVKSLANHFGSHVIIGLDAKDDRGQYNAAFYFGPSGSSAVRYDKQHLMPIAEYVPLRSWPFIAKWCAEQFGIEDSFTEGERLNLFEAAVPLGVSICSEETFPALARASRRAGAKLFVNLTNDGWFPKTRLARIHFQLARLRAAENGVGVVRACNTGITGVIDRFGRTVKTLPETERGVLVAEVLTEAHPTPYTFWGDFPLLVLSALFILVNVLRRFKVA